MASDLKLDLVIPESQRGPNVHLMGNLAVSCYILSVPGNKSQKQISMLTGILLVCQGTNLKNRHDNNDAC